MLDNYQIICEKWKWKQTETITQYSSSIFSLIERKRVIPKQGYYIFTIPISINYGTTVKKFLVKYLKNDDKKIRVSYSGNEELYKDINNNWILNFPNLASAESIKSVFDEYPEDFQVLEYYGQFNQVKDLQYQRYMTMYIPEIKHYNKIYPNFFSEDEKELINTIDLKEYLIDIGTLNYSFESVDDDGTALNIFYEDSDINFICSGIKNNKYLKTFFGINENTDLYKYLVKIYKDEQIIFKGVINQSSIEETFCDDNDSEQLQIQALGFMQEFKDYYVKKILPDVGTDILLEDLLVNHLFNSNIVNIELEDELKDYMVRYNPGIYKNTDSLNHTYSIWKTGYKRIYDLNENCWDFIYRLCNAMGWIVFYYNDKLYIQNRSTNKITNEILDYNKFIEYTAKKSEVSETYDSIFIYDGEFYGGDDAGMRDTEHNAGDYFYIFTNRGEDLKCTIPWREVGTNSSDYRLYFENQRYIKFYKEDDTTFIYKYYVNNPNGTYGATQYTIPQNQLLRIDAGSTAGKGWIYWTDNGEGTHNYPLDEQWNDWDEHPDDVYFNGNYGNILYKTINNRYQTYPDYVLTNTFKNNYMKFINTNSSNKLKVRYNGIEINPTVKYTITNNDELSGIWTVNSISYDFITNESELELQKKIIE